MGLLIVGPHIFHVTAVIKYSWFALVALHIFPPYLKAQIIIGDDHLT